MRACLKSTESFFFLYVSVFFGVTLIVNHSKKEKYYFGLDR